MTVKRRDFQKIASNIHQFLLKLTDTYECAELRDSLNLSLVQLQKYYRRCQSRLQHTGRFSNNNNGSTSGNDVGYVSPRQSLRITLTRSNGEPPMSPMTPYIEEPNYFHVRWTELDESIEKLRSSLNGDDCMMNNSSLDLSKSLNTPPIHYGAKTEDFELLNQLYNEKPDVLDDQDCIGRTPLMYAVYYDKLQVAKWFLKKGADPNSCDFNELSSIHWACYQGNCDMIELLLEACSYINCQDSFGRSPCHWACTCETTDCLQLLIQYNGNINLHDKNGLTPAMWACRLDHSGHLHLLSRVSNQTVDHIDGYERDRNGRTIIHWSIRRQGPLECLKHLLSCDMANLRDDEGKTVLLLASEQGALESCKLIIETIGTQYINDVDDKGRTCLHLATIGGHGEVVNFLLESGANFHTKDQSGATCLDIAQNQFLYYCQLIISSHIREKERCKSSEIINCVELIEKVSSKRNSLSEFNRSFSRSSPTKSPKNSTSKSPKLTRQRKKLSLNSTTIDNDDAMVNGFDIMTSDPIVNRNLKKKKRNSKEETTSIDHPTNEIHQSNEQIEPIDGENDRKDKRRIKDVTNKDNQNRNGSNKMPEVAREASGFDVLELDPVIGKHGNEETADRNQDRLYSPGPYDSNQQVDVLNAETGHEYHTEPDLKDNSNASIQRSEVSRKFQRAQKKNLLENSLNKRNRNTNRDNNSSIDSSTIRNPSTPPTIEHEHKESIPDTFVEREAPPDLYIHPVNPPPEVISNRINYGAPLEPLNRNPEPTNLNNNNQNAPRKKKRRQKRGNVLDLNGLDDRNNLSRSMEHIQSTNRSTNEPTLNPINSKITGSSMNRLSSPNSNNPLSSTFNSSTRSLLDMTLEHQRKSGRVSSNNLSELKYPVNKPTSNSQPNTSRSEFSTSGTIEQEQERLLNKPIKPRKQLPSLM